MRMMVMMAATMICKDERLTAAYDPDKDNEL
jgi:hypothetical protein